MRPPIGRLGVDRRAECLWATLLIASLVACGGGDSPTDPIGSPLLPDFNCEESSACTLTCTDRTTGGKRPYLLFWQADEQPPTSVVNPTFTWRFAGSSLVRVRLSVTDGGGEGETRGPVERAFSICESASKANGATVSVPIPPETFLAADRSGSLWQNSCRATSAPFVPNLRWKSSTSPESPAVFAPRFNRKLSALASGRLPPQAAR